MGTITQFYEASNSTPGEVAEGGGKTYTRTFHVVTSGVVGPAEVFAHSTCPRWGNVYASDAGDFDPDAVCVGLSAKRRDESPYLWTVEARYATQTAEAGGGGEGGGEGVGAITGGPVNPADPLGGGSSEGGGEGGGEGGAGAAGGEAPPTLVENPLLRPAEFSWDSEEVMLPLTQDRAGNAVVNSAGFPFDPPLEYEAVRPVLTVVKNMPLAAINASFIQNRNNHLNSVDWMGFPAKTLKLKVSARSAYENGIWYWATTYIFRVKIDGWNPVRVLDAGYEELDPGGTWLTIRDENGAPVSRPWLLDGAGIALTPGDPEEYLEFTVYGEFDFAELGLF